MVEQLEATCIMGQLGNQDALNDYYPWMNTYNLNAKYPFGGQLTPGLLSGVAITLRQSLGSVQPHGALVLTLLSSVV